MLKINKQEYNLLSQNAYKSSKEEIIQIRKIFLSTALIRNIIFYSLYFIFSAFCVYYVIVFCSVYEGSSANWIADCWIGIILFYLESLAILILLVLLRLLMRAYPNMVTKGLHWVFSLFA